jgi:hypothetical protein
MVRPRVKGGDAIGACQDGGIGAGSTGKFQGRREMSRIVLPALALFCLGAISARADPIVQNRDEPGRNPYQAHASISASCSFQNGCVATFPVIPAGERVVVEYVSCMIAVASGTNPVIVALGGQAKAPTNRAFVLATFQGEISNIVNYVVSAPVVFYYATGDTPTISVLLNGSVGSSPGDCLLTGYHVIIP